MKTTMRSYKLMGMTRILGAQAANPKVHSEYIASKVDNYVFISPAYLRFTRGGAEVREASEVFERPLRAMTMQGPRVSVAASEVINAGWELAFTVELLENPASPKSKALTFEVIEEALDYGRFKGLGQWRNGQNGRFEWERVE